MFASMPETAMVALVGLFGGILLGLAARLGRFCTLGAIEDLLYSGSSRRMRMWGLAIATAITGSFALIGLGMLDAGESIYFSIKWVPMASIVGGLIFGYGMALSGNCGFGSLARLGGGDLRAFVIVLVMGTAAYATLYGPFSFLRLWAFPQEPATGVQGLAHAGAALSGIPAPALGIAVGLGLAAFCLANREMLANRAGIFWSVAAGLAVVSGWAGTQWVADTGFAAVPIVSHSFSAPLGETMIYAMTGSARPLSFAVGSVAGVWTGAFIGSLIKGHFRWEACEDPRELRRQILGAALMGMGAVIAMGCTIGQGITAFSLLSYSAPVTFASIFAGAALGLRQLITGFMPAE